MTERTSCLPSRHRPRVRATRDTPARYSHHRATGGIARRAATIVRCRQTGGGRGEQVSRTGERIDSGTRCSNSAATPGGAALSRATGFVIGVFDQPSYTFPKWSSRGINTVINYQSLSGTVPFSTWHDALVQDHLMAIRPPVGDPSQDAHDPALLAWMQPDEPELNHEQALVQANYRAWHAAAPQIPVWLNVSGGSVAKETQSELAPYLSSADWISDDIYPVTGWDQPGGLDLNEEGDWIGGTLNTLAGWSGRKPQLQIVETSNQQLSWIPNSRGVTPDEFRGSVWVSVIHGAKGVIYFPQSFGSGFSYDGTPDDVVAEMTKVDAQLKQWSTVLLAPGHMTVVPKPFEQATRALNGRTYVITLNFSHSPAELNGVSYAPYQVRITTPSGLPAVPPQSRFDSVRGPRRWSARRLENRRA